MHFLMSRSNLKRGLARVSPAIWEQFPQYCLRVVYAFGVNNGPSDSDSRADLLDAASSAMAVLGSARPSDHPHVAAWRKAYAAFGAKPSHFPSSIESLLRRSLKEGAGGIPGINRLVDLYNALSLTHVIPVGGEDLDRVVGTPTLRFARGDEPFDLPDHHGGMPSFPTFGEVVWADGAGVTCRNWNWRQGRRTRLTERTSNAYFILEGLAPACIDEHLDAAAATLEELLMTRAGAREVVVARHGPSHTDVACAV